MIKKLIYMYINVDVSACMYFTLLDGILKNYQADMELINVILRQMCENFKFHNW